MAKALARIAHHGQTRMDGVEPFINHPARVATRLASDPATTWGEVLAAWLHDVVEDTAVTFADLQDFGFDEEVISIVIALTRDDYETYAEYIERVAKNRSAVRVKLADLADNLASLPDGHSLRERYQKAYSQLKGAQT
jgi:(p)ppGpp synthase/HD superfamily hydrolase